jgi:hypothetical protein
MTNRLNTYQLDEDGKKAEHEIIKQILITNGYDNQTKEKRKNKSVDEVIHNNNEKIWTKFAYVGQQTKLIKSCSKTPRQK